jgi:hypothetical protein
MHKEEQIAILVFCGIVVLVIYNRDKFAKTIVLAPAGTYVPREIRFSPTQYLGGVNDFYKMAYEEPHTLFIFNDNIQRTGRGGNAVIRGLPNAIGIATGISTLPPNIIYKGFDGLNNAFTVNEMRGAKGLDDDDLLNVPTPKTYIDSDIAKIHLEIKSGRFNRVRYSADAGGALAFNNFDPHGAVRAYLNHLLDNLDPDNNDGWWDDAL